MSQLFSFSHIMIISSPSCEFDIGFIRFFRIVDTLRNKMLPSLVELLKSLLGLPINKAWIYAGRPCSPWLQHSLENRFLLSNLIKECNRSKDFGNMIRIGSSTGHDNSNSNQLSKTKNKILICFGSSSLSI